MARCRRILVVLLTGAVALLDPAVAPGAPIVVSPDAVDTTGKITSGGSAPVHLVTNEYDGLGIRFDDPSAPTAWFNDGSTLAWGGVRAGVVDLLGAVHGRIVVPAAGGAPARTSRLSVEAGFADTGNLRLQVFGCDGGLLGSTVNDDGTGSHGRTLLTLALPGIHSFRVTTPSQAGPDGAPDSFGVDTIELEPPAPCAASAPPPPPAPAPPPPPPPPSPADRDSDGVADAHDNCGAVANPDQSDRDRDGIGDRCEELPSGDAPPVAGVSTVVRIVGGEVLVRLPAGARAGRAHAAQRSSAGFRPLKGIASLPVGTVVDARKGRVEISAAGDFERPRAEARRLQVGVFEAAMFRIDQTRRRAKAQASRPTTDLVLQTPPGLARACERNAQARPIKGVVRAFTGNSQKGAFRTLGARAEVTVAGRATWIVQDRCNGTLTELGRGRARIFDRSLKRTLVLRAGQGYLARAPLFAAPGKGRPARGELPRRGA